MLDLAGLIIEVVVDWLVVPRHFPPSDRLTVLGKIAPEPRAPHDTPQPGSAMLS
jgi:hypothetical protein